MSTTTPAAGGVGRGRTLAGLTVAAVGLAGITAALVPMRGGLGLASIVLLYLVPVVAVAAVGGLWPALAAAVGSDLLVNFFFVPPYHTFTIETRDNLITVLVYVAVAIAVSVAVDLAARQRATAARHGVEAALLARITAEPLGQGSLPVLLEHVRASLGMSSAALVEDGHVVAIAGQPEPDRPALTVPAGGNLTLAVYGPEVFAPDRRFLTRLATAAARAWQAERLAGRANRAEQLVGS